MMRVTHRCCWATMLLSIGATLAACSASDSDPSTKVEREAKALLGIWVSTDDPQETFVLELLTHDPYNDVLAGQGQVYRMWQYPPAAEPVVTQLGGFAVAESELQTTPAWAASEGIAGQTWGNTIISHEGDRLVLASQKVASGERTLERVATFPGGDYGGGAPTPDAVVEPSTRQPLGEKPSTNSIAHLGYLFRVGPDEVVATRALTYKFEIEVSTPLETYRSTDRGGSWSPITGETRPGTYNASPARFKEQAHGLPLIFPTDSLSEYLYLWNGELAAWDRDNAVQICRERAGFADQDIVLRSAKGIAYTACIADDNIAVHRRVLSLNSNRVAYIAGPVKRVAAQWLKEDTEHGTLYVMAFSGQGEKPFKIFSYAETHEMDFAGFGDPVAEIAVDGASCEITDIRRYFITADNVHHIIALATRDDLPKKAHPLAPDNRLAIHIHGLLGGSFTTDVLNVQDGAFLGNLIDVDFPLGHQGAPDTLYATFQDNACLRVSSSPGASIAWQPLGVVPTFHRPLADSVLVWDDDRLGLLSRATMLEYLALEILPDQSRCATPRSLQ